MVTQEPETAHAIHHPDYLELQGTVREHSVRLADQPRPKKVVPHRFDLSFVSDELAHSAAYNIANAISLFVEGAFVVAISLIVFALLLHESDPVRIGVPIIVGGILLIIVGLFIHPWMRKHLPQKEA